MKKILLTITVFLLFSVTQSSGQSFSKSEWDIISKGVLDQNAENKLLRRNAKADSATIAFLLVSHMDADSVISKLFLKNTNLQKEKSNDMHLISFIYDENKKYKKEIRKQRTLKWVGVIVTAIFVGLIMK